MSAELSFVLCLAFITAVLTIGIVFVYRGYKEDENGNRNLGFIRAGWIIIASLSLLITAGIVFLAVVTSWIVGFLFVVLPFVVLIGLVITLAYGISNLITGYQRDKNGHFDIVKIKVGWINIGVNLTVITAIFVLLMMFMTGIIPIRLM